MLVGSVIDNEVDDYADAALLAAMGELDKIAERAVARIDAVVIGDVVAVILARRRLKRHQPDRADAKTVQIVKPAQQSLEIADAVSIGIHIGADGKTIEDAILVPEIVDHQTSLHADLRAAISRGAALSSTGQMAIGTSTRLSDERLGLRSRWSETNSTLLGAKPIECERQLIIHARLGKSRDRNSDQPNGFSRWH